MRLTFERDKFNDGHSGTSDDSNDVGDIGLPHSLTQFGQKTLLVGVRKVLMGHNQINITFSRSVSVLALSHLPLRKI